MKTNISQPDYGPVRSELNLEVEPTFKQCVDDLLHLLIFLPANTIVEFISHSLHALEMREKKLLGIRIENSSTHTT